MSQRIVNDVHARYPHLLGRNDHPADGHFLYRACEALGPDWRLVHKDGHENGVTWPNGVRTSHDAICQVDASGRKVAMVDIITAAGNGIATTPSWGIIPEHEWRASNVPVPLSAVPAPDGGSSEPKPPPSGGPTRWEPRHTTIYEALRAHAPGMSSLMIAEQMAYTFPGERWGTKSADPNRPVSVDVIARDMPGELFGYRVLPQLSTTEIPLTGQHFHPVHPRNHLAATTPVDPSPDPEPEPKPPPWMPDPSPGPEELAVLLAAVASLRADLATLRDTLADIRRTLDRPLDIVATNRVFGTVSGTITPKVT